MNWPDLAFASALINIVVKQSEQRWQAVDEQCVDLWLYDTVFAVKS